MFTYSVFEHDYEKSYFKYKEPISSDYTVTVNGEAVPVYTCRISEYPLNRVMTGVQRSGEQSEVVSFVNLISDEPLDITVHIKFPYQNAFVKPYSKCIELVSDGDTASFTLTENGQFVFEADSYHRCLYIFNSPPISAPSPDEVTHYFGAGVHFPGKITLSSNESVYIDKDALVFGCIYADNAENIRIFGNGVFDDRTEGRCDINCYEAYTNGNLKFYDCKNLRIEGVLLRDSAIWCVNLFHCYDVDIDGIKIFGQWRYNTDGIDIVNSQNISVKNSFVHSFDDSITIKAIDRYAETDNKNIFVENCVLWCDWGKTCELGIETYCRRYQNIAFRSCDILRAGHIAMCVDNGEDAEMSDIIFEDIRVEYNSFDTASQYQDTDETVYNKHNEVAFPVLLCITNERWRTAENERQWGIPQNHPSPIDFSGIECASVHDVICRSIRVYYDKNMPMAEDGRYNVNIKIGSSVEGVKFKRIAVSDVKINGIPLSKDNAFICANEMNELRIC